MKLYTKLLRVNLLMAFFVISSAFSMEDIPAETTASKAEDSIAEQIKKTFQETHPKVIELLEGLSKQEIEGHLPLLKQLFSEAIMREENQEMVLYLEHLSKKYGINVTRSYDSEYVSKKIQESKNPISARDFLRDAKKHDVDMASIKIPKEFFLDKIKISKNIRSALLWIDIAKELNVDVKIPHDEEFFLDKIKQESYYNANKWFEYAKKLNVNVKIPSKIFSDKITQTSYYSEAEDWVKFAKELKVDVKINDAEKFFLDKIQSSGCNDAIGWIHVANELEVNLNITKDLLLNKAREAIQNDRPDCLSELITISNNKNTPIIEDLIADISQKIIQVIQENSIMDFNAWQELVEQNNIQLPPEVMQAMQNFLQQQQAPTTQECVNGVTNFANGNLSNWIEGAQSVHLTEPAVALTILYLNNVGIRDNILSFENALELARSWINESEIEDKNDILSVLGNQGLGDPNTDASFRGMFMFSIAATQKNDLPWSKEYQTIEARKAKIVSAIQASSKGFAYSTGISCKRGIATRCLFAIGEMFSDDSQNETINNIKKAINLVIVNQYTRGWIGSVLNRIKVNCPSITFEQAKNIYNECMGKVFDHNQYQLQNAPHNIKNAFDVIKNDISSTIKATFDNLEYVGEYKDTPASESEYENIKKNICKGIGEQKQQQSQQQQIQEESQQQQTEKKQVFQHQEEQKVLQQQINDTGQAIGGVIPSSNEDISDLPAGVSLSEQDVLRSFANFSGISGMTANLIDQIAENTGNIQPNKINQLKEAIKNFLIHRGKITKDGQIIR